MAGKHILGIYWCLAILWNVEINLTKLILPAGGGCCGDTATNQTCEEHILKTIHCLFNYQFSIINSPLLNHFPCEAFTLHIILQIGHALEGLYPIEVILELVINSPHVGMFNL